MAEHPRAKRNEAVQITYFNYRTHIAESGWDRRSFIANWWRIYAGDPRWVPPYYPTLRRELEPANNRHLARLSPVFMRLEALPRRSADSRRSAAPVSQALVSGALFEEPVAAVVALYDRRRRDNAAYLALLHCANDPEPLERLLEQLREALRGRGCRHLIGPTGLSPHLGTGLLQDYWGERPPLYTPYNPPYLPEVVETTLRPLGHSRLYYLEVPSDPPVVPSSPARLAPLEPARLTTDLLPLFAEACPAWADFPPLDSEEAAFLLRWVGNWPLYGWWAEMDGEPAGFLLLQPDLAPLLRRANGGRSWLWRPWLAWASRRPARQGRVLFGAVSPEWRGRGIGRQLLQQALAFAHSQGWEHLSIGPLPSTAPACSFLERWRAQPRQSYLLYQTDL